MENVQKLYNHADSYASSYTVKPYLEDSAIQSGTTAHQGGRSRLVVIGKINVTCYGCVIVIGYVVQFL